MLVDDERLVLDALAPRLRRRVDVVTAIGPHEALDKLTHGPNVAVIVSDMRMPHMNGAQLLRVVRDRWPETVRMLLTGHTDFETAMSAVNDGHIYRFLTKPCPPDVLVKAVEAGVAQHRLVVAERELLETTVRGIVDTLTEVLELASPASFSAGRRIRVLAVAMAEAQHLSHERWALELAALLGQLGKVSLSPETVQRQFLGEALSEPEQRAIEQVHPVTQRLLRHIPRFERVCELLQLAHGEAPSDSPYANILKVAEGYYLSSSRGLVFSEAFAQLDHDARYDRQALDALAEVQGLARRSSRVVELSLIDLRPGMVLADNVTSPQGNLLLVKGHLLSESVLERLYNCARSNGVHEPIRVWDDRDSPHDSPTHASHAA